MKILFNNTEKFITFSTVAELGNFKYPQESWMHGCDPPRPQCNSAGMTQTSSMPGPMQVSYSSSCCALLFGCAGMDVSSAFEPPAVQPVAMAVPLLQH